MEVIRKLKSVQGEYKNFLAENTRYILHLVFVELTARVQLEIL